MGKPKFAYSYYGNRTWKTIRKICLPPMPRKIDIHRDIKIIQ